MSMRLVLNKILISENIRALSTGKIHFQSMASIGFLVISQIFVNALKIFHFGQTSMNAWPIFLI